MINGLDNAARSAAHARAGREGKKMFVYRAETMEQSPRIVYWVRSEAQGTPDPVHDQAATSAPVIFYVAEPPVRA